MTCGIAGIILLAIFHRSLLGLNRWALLQGAVLGLFVVGILIILAGLLVCPAL